MGLNIGVFKLKILTLFIMYCSICLGLYADQRPTKQQVIDYCNIKQDSPNSENPLQGISIFIFSARFPANKAVYDKISSLLKNELSKYGTVRSTKMLVQKEKDEAIDVTGFDEGVFLIYDIENVLSIDGKNLGIVRASLSLQSSIQILKTKQECFPYIWSRNCFLKGNTNKNIEKLFMKSLDYLMCLFLNSYLTSNTNKPIFILDSTNPLLKIYDHKVT